MNEYFLFPIPMHYFSPPDDGGGSGGGSGDGGGDGNGGGGSGGQGGNTQAAAVSENNQSIKTLTQSISGGGDGSGGDKKDPMERHLGYFADDDSGGDAPFSGGEEPEGQQGDEGGDQKKKAQQKQQQGQQGDEGGDQKKKAQQKQQQGQQGDEGGDGEDAKFYDPNRDVEDPENVYPNAYESRMDAQMAVAAKIEKMDELKNTLEENNSQLGAIIDPDLKKHIEDFRDYNHGAEVSDDELKSFISDIDRGIKATSGKVDRVTTKAKQSRKKREAETQRNKLQKKANQASRELGLADRIAELPDKAQLEDVMNLTDEVIDNNLAEVNQEIEDHRDDENYAEEHGIKEYNAKMDRLTQQRQELMDDMNEQRQTIKDWWEAEQNFREVQDQDTELSDAELMQRRDQAFFRFAEDRGEGPNALPVFKHSKDSAPIKALRQYAYHPQNIGKYDLTTEEGWYYITQDWQNWVSEQEGKDRTTQQTKQDQGNQGKRKSSYEDEIPTPGSSQGHSYIPPGADEEGLAKTNKDIGRLARSIMGS